MCCLNRRTFETWVFISAEIFVLPDEFPRGSNKVELYYISLLLFCDKNKNSNSNKQTNKQQESPPPQKKKNPTTTPKTKKQTATTTKNKKATATHKQKLK